MEDENKIFVSSQIKNNKNEKPLVVSSKYN